MVRYLFSKAQKENVDNYFIVYVSRGIAKHLTRYTRVKAHAISVSILAFTLACSLNFGEISMNKIQADASYLYVLMYFAMSPYAVCFEGYTFIVVLSNRYWLGCHYWWPFPSVF